MKKSSDDRSYLRMIRALFPTAGLGGNDSVGPELAACDQEWTIFCFCTHRNQFGKNLGQREMLNGNVFMKPTLNAVLDNAVASQKLWKSNR